jgi:valyl-tRNA synthetase
MSKSLGNGVDPFDVIDKYGCDSLRYFLTTNSAPGLDLRYDETKVESSWNYLNKIWNISRYIIMNIPAGYEYKNPEKEFLTLPSKWILKTLNDVIKNVDYNMDTYEFGEAARTLYNFVWNDFASWYVEISKVDLQSGNSMLVNSTIDTLIYTLKAIIKMLHPFIPFITEEIYQSIPHEDKSIMISSWPTINIDYDFKLEQEQISYMIDAIKEVRVIRKNYEIKNAKPIDILILPKNENVLNGLRSTNSYLNKFINPKELIFIDKEPENIKDYVVIVLSSQTIYIPQGELINKEEAILKLKEAKERLEKELARSKGMLSNKSFIEKAPQAKVEQEKAKLKSYEEEYDKIIKSLKEFE